MDALGEVAAGQAGDPGPSTQAVGDGGALRAAIAGGGTAGHAYPAAALARALATAGAEVRMIGTPMGPEARLAAADGFPFDAIDVAGLQRSLTWRNLVAGAKLARAVSRCLAILGGFEPDVVVGTGGYVSLPVALAAAIHRIPLVLHEQNAVPGLANRLASRFAAAVAVSFPGTEQRFGPRARLTGNPIRASLAAGNRDALRPEGLEHFALAPERRTLLVFGGSQGARRLNEAALAAYNRWRDDERLQVLQLAGPRDALEVGRRLADLRGAGDSVVWRLVDFTERMDLAYAVADLAVCRAGASTISELAASSLPAILVPYPHATEDHQRRNAEALAATGGAEVADDAGVDGLLLTSRVEALIFDEDRLAAMGEAVRGFALPDAARRLAALVREVAAGGTPGGRSARVPRDAPPPGQPGDAPPPGQPGDAPPSPQAPPGGETPASPRTRPARPAGPADPSGPSVLQWIDPPGRRFHLVGIGGAGMSAIARVIHAAGASVSGSDLRDSSVLRNLRALGIRVDIGHRTSPVGRADVVIASAAVPADNPELVEARAAGITVLSRGEALARLVEGRRTVAVSGTHGKSTTAGMIATVAETCGLEPTWLLGANLGDLGPGGRLGAGSIAVVEADEAYGSFLELHPDVAVVTNVDVDHLDHYGTMPALEQAFRRFMASASEWTIVCGDDGRAGALAPSGARVLTYGFGEADEVQAVDVVHGAGGSTFRLAAAGRDPAAVTLRVAGRHNVLNAVGAAAACLVLGLEPRAIADGLATFRGVSRRFEHRGRVDGADLVDDYAHHPTEIEATLEAARWGPWSRIVAVFQPHLYSRTQSLWREFGAALAHADVVVVTDVYGAREEPVPGVTGKLIVDAACDAAPGKRVAYLPHLEEAAGFVRTHIRPGDLVLSLGAGDVTSLPDRILALP